MDALPLLSVRVDITAGTATVVLSGDLDLMTCPLLAARLAEIAAREPHRLVFDLARVGFIDCASMRIIIDSARFLPRGQRPVIRRPSAPVRRVLDLTGWRADCEIVS
jgi:anti-anti-sigma factor